MGDILYCIPHFYYIILNIYIQTIHSMTDKEIVFFPSMLMKPLYTSYYSVADVYGGRGRGGSHGITEHAIYEMISKDYFRGYICRAVQSSIRGSLWQDFKDRLDELSDINGFDVKALFKISDSKMYAEYKPNGNSLKAKGFRASTKGNTAHMKSIAGATHVYIEECEEIGKEEYNKLSDSLRTIKGLNLDSKKDEVLDKIINGLYLNTVEYLELDVVDKIKDNKKALWKYIKTAVGDKPSRQVKFLKSLRVSSIKVIRSWNSPPKEHWLVKDYYNLMPSGIEGYYKLEPKGVEGHLSIFGDYIKNIENLDADTIARYLRYKETQPRYYYNQIKGFVYDGGDKKTYYGWEKISIDRFNAIDGVECYGVDFGDTAPTALVHIKYKDGCFYRRELLYSSLRSLKVKHGHEIKNFQDNLYNQDGTIPEDKYSLWGKHRGVLTYVFNELNVDKDIIMFCDPAQKGLIEELRAAGYNAVQATKDKKANINFINRAFNYYTEDSENLEAEYDTNYLETDINKEIIDGKPVKGNDHALEASEYGCRGLKDTYNIVL